MKLDRNLIFSAVILVLCCALYRLVPYPTRPLGFAPQIAVALFSGSIIKNRKYAFLMPLMAMFVSDLFFEVLYRNGLSEIKGFYGGQLTNYLLFVGLTVIGFFVKANSVKSIGIGSIVAPTVYFVFSNFSSWAFGGLKINGAKYTTSLSDFWECYTVALPFYKNSIVATICFAAVFFGSYALVNSKLKHRAIA